MTEPLFVLKCQHLGEHFDIPYQSLRDCTEDRNLASMLESGGVVVAIWVGALRVTARPMGTFEELSAQLIGNASAIVRRGCAAQR